MDGTSFCKFYCKKIFLVKKLFDSHPRKDLTKLFIDKRVYI